MNFWRLKTLVIPEGNVSSKRTSRFKPWVIVLVKYVECTPSRQKKSLVLCSAQSEEFPRPKNNYCKENAKNDSALYEANKKLRQKLILIRDGDCKNPEAGKSLINSVRRKIRMLDSYPRRSKLRVGLNHLLKIIWDRELGGKLTVGILRIRIKPLSLNIKITKMIISNKEEEGMCSIWHLYSQYFEKIKS